MNLRKDWATFNIRKITKKSVLKGSEQFGSFTPQIQFEKYPEVPTYTSITSNKKDPKRQKQIIIDYSINQAILNSKIYSDLNNSYNENRRRYTEKKLSYQQQIQKLKKQLQEALEEQKKVQLQKAKYLQLLAEVKTKIINIRQKNAQTRDLIQDRMSNEAQYLSNLLYSMRFQAQYDHDIDPDQMTYEELLQLQQKIGKVSKGLPLQVLQKIPKKQLQSDLQDQCIVCVQIMKKGEKVTILPPCGHTFHEQCLDSWLANEKICPLCKRQIYIK